mmetsp:Transcript_70814/g.124996  ORF Transcript_70814/g.124996 Transcript_70814/m.124996 type:complete len:375 (+) Transcript_70814:69-1193(+)|eukprot:CAMPEP_0197621412 /NCGR_PEP_ID=MMETSP1338-20131121/2015_1 /TAXON_ID=43686 ORGANISM="Pelagodinium beii, Strain RCC1491" /NCGR_SAMPLE_ID=MMETSP1338 /ASSEMBLY_ACC=CAM_ASM_000754 /LENGTH=374 /DNA_ID=CAMNT_0043190889 /DNA_START=66 /DNA_END=1190 /DNA_ORIENTATION=+
MDSLQYSANVCITPANLMRLFKQPKFWIAMAVAFPCGIVGGGLRAYQTYTSDTTLQSVITNNAPYETLTFVAAFLSAFRIQAAYSKFWEGCDHAYNIVGDFFDTSADLVAYTRNSKAPPEEVDDFRQLIIRLFSLLNSVVFAELETGVQRNLDDKSGKTPTAYTFELLDIAGIEESCIDTLINTENKVELVYHWIECVIIEAWHKKIFSVDPPIMTRSLMDLSHGIEHFHEAQKITEVPFPFPYQMALQSVLIMHWMITPIVTASWTDYYVACAFLCVTGVFSMWFFVGIAMDLDQPFSFTQNSIDVRYLQKLLNHRLLSLLQAAKHGPPTLSKTVRRTMSRKSMKEEPGSQSSTGGGLIEMHQRRTKAAGGEA